MSRSVRLCGTFKKKSSSRFARLFEHFVRTLRIQTYFSQIEQQILHTAVIMLHEKDFYKQKKNQPNEKVLKNLGIYHDLCVCAVLSENFNWGVSAVFLSGPFFSIYFFRFL